MNSLDPAIDRLPAAPAPTWMQIPGLAGRLLWQHWPALLFWFFAQRVAYDLLLALAIRLGETSVLLSYGAVAVLIVAQLLGVIAMLLVLRPSLPTMAPGGPQLSRYVQVRPWLNVLAIALLPFFAYYATWGLLDGVKRDFTLSYLYGVSFDNRERLSDILSLKGLWIALIVALVLRLAAKRLYTATGSGVWSVISAICDAYWLFVGAAVIAKGYAWARDWWHARVAYVAVTDWWENPFAGVISLAPLKRVVEPLWDVVGTAFGGMIMPLVWLAITALVYGMDLRRRGRLDAAESRLRLAARRYRHMHLVWRRIIEKFAAGWTSKGVPILNSIRLVLRAGLPALLVLCVGWQLLAFIDAHAWRVVAEWIGPHDWREWRVLGGPASLLFNGPISLRPALFTELLRIVLLAATFDRAVAGLRRLPRHGQEAVA